MNCTCSYSLFSEMGEITKLRLRIIVKWMHTIIYDMSLNSFPKLLVAIIAFANCLSSSGQQFEWARQIGGNSTIEFRDALPIPAGGYAICGRFTGTADFDPGPGQLMISSVGNEDLFITRIDTAGNLLWAHTIGNSNADHIDALHVDDAGNIYFAGYFTGTIDFDPGPGIFNLSSANPNLSNSFLCKWSPAGAFIWVIRTDVPAKHLSIDISGNLLLAGFFAAPTDFDPGPGNYTLTPQGFSDFYIAKMSSAGSFIAAKQLDARNTSNVTALIRDHSGSIFLGGTFSDTLDSDPGSGIHNLISNGQQDAFIIKMNANLEFIWSRSFGGSNEDVIRSLSSDRNGNLLISGLFTGTADFDPGPSSFILSSAGISDACFTKFDSSGNFLWTRKLGGTSLDDAYDIVSDSSGNVYSTGVFFTTASFDPLAGAQTLSSTGGSWDFDSFVCKFSPSGKLIWARSFGGIDDDAGLAIDVRSSGDVVSFGNFESVADFDPDTSGVFNLTASGQWDIYIHKLSQTSTGVGLADTQHPTELSVYPNPSDGLFNIRFNTSSDNAAILIYDVSGKLVHKADLILLNQIDLRHLEAGIYFADIQSGKDHFRNVLIIRK